MHFDQFLHPLQYTSVYLSDSPSVERSFGKVALEGFQFEAAHNDSIGAIVEVGVTDAHVLRTIYLGKCMEVHGSVWKGLRSSKCTRVCRVHVHMYAEYAEYASSMPSMPRVCLE